MSGDVDPQGWRALEYIDSCNDRRPHSGRGGPATFETLNDPTKLRLTQPESPTHLAATGPGAVSEHVSDR